jgi:uncharacterized protein with von Willebrand factor type A (vWA) domain
MLPYSRLCNQLFTAVNKSNHFKDLKIFYFHNCIYDWLYTDASCSQSAYIDTEYVLKTYSTDYRVIIVGDASMAPSELMREGGVIDWNLHNERPGMEWLRRLRQKFGHSAWLNPVQSKYWDWMTGAFSIKAIGEVFPMDELTVEGLERSIKRIRRDRSSVSKVIQTSAAVSSKRQGSTT